MPCLSIRIFDLLLPWLFRWVWKALNDTIQSHDFEHTERFLGFSCECQKAYSKEKLTLVYYHHVTFGVLRPGNISGITLTMAIMYGKKPPLVTSMHNRFSAIYTLELAEPGKDWQHRIKAISAIKFVLLLLQVESQTKKPVFIYPYLHWLAYSSCSRIPSLPLEIWEGTFFKTNTLPI